MNTLRVLLVDDHPSVRMGTRTLIREAYNDTEICEAGNTSEALELLRAREFDLVFLDLRIPSDRGQHPHVDSGKLTLRAIREMDGPPVVIMSAESPDRPLIEEIMAAGAASFVPKSADASVSLEAIRRTLAGGVWLPPEAIGKGGSPPPVSPETLLGPLPRPITHEDLGITPRAFDVLRLALSGRNPKKIALTLGINHDNVKKHMSRLYEKFGTADQASLHAYFAKTGQTLGIIQTLPRVPTPENSQSPQSKDRH